MSQRAKAGLSDSFNNQSAKSLKSVRNFASKFWHESRPRDKLLAVLSFITVLCFAIFFVLAVSEKIGLLIVRSSSMEPYMPSGSLVVFFPTGVEGVENGEIIVFKDGKSASTLVTHRVVAKQVENGRVIFRTKGDGNSNSDSAIVDSSNIVGRVSCIIPIAGRLMAFVKTPIGLLSLDLVLISLMVMIAVDKIRASIKASFLETLRGIDDRRGESYGSDESIQGQQSLINPAKAVQKREQGFTEN